MDEAGARPLAAAMGMEETRECWICLETGGADLIAPCSCTGSTRWVHRTCLDTWRARAPNPRMYMHCRHCDFRYLLERRFTVRGGDEERGVEATPVRRRRLVGQAVRHFAINAALVQLVLLLLAICIRFLDRRERLVGLLGIDRLDEPCAPGGGSWVDTLRCRKVTYYLVALVCLLAAAGVFGAARLCIQSFRRRRQRHGSGACRECTYLCCFLCDFCFTNRAGGRTACQLIFQAPKALLVFGLLSLATLVVAGIFFVVVGLVMWAQHVVQCYLQAAELGALTEEYVVKDLSATPLTRPPDPQSMPGEPFDVVQGQLLNELHTVYGLEDGPTQGAPVLAFPV
mmetsp:Transcript_20745/g.58823  ORF Transcript_20745/g.58823 Transcript_20745/m.58823 type:complete len:342 (+) Transcript_20745:2-1027(+)